jgi:hypothetical protein
MPPHRFPAEALSALPTNQLCDDVFEEWRTVMQQASATPTVEVLQELADAVDPDERARVLDRLTRGLPGADWPQEDKLRALTLLTELAAGAEPRVRARALIALLHLNLRGPPVSRVMLRALADPEPAVRSTALAVVARDPLLVGQHRLVVQLLRGMDDIAAVVRRTAVRGLCEAGPCMLEKAPHQTRDLVIRKLFEVLDDGSPAVACDAAEALFAIIHQGLLRSEDVVVYLEARPVTLGAAVLACDKLGAASESFVLRAAATPAACRPALNALARSGPEALAHGLRRLRAADRDLFATVTSDWAGRSRARRRVWEQALRLVLGQLTPVLRTG